MDEDKHYINIRQRANLCQIALITQKFNEIVEKDKLKIV